MVPVRVAAVVDVTLAEGPGARFALWTQGCAIRCPGCCNPHMFDPAGGFLVEPGDLLRRVDAVRDRIEGVTLLGGEPFEQAGALAPFARAVRAGGFSVVAFSGHPLEDLLALKLKAQGAKDLMDAAILVLMHPDTEGRARSLATAYRALDRFEAWLLDPRARAQAREERPDVARRGRAGRADRVRRAG
ncbi:MAG TPA: 4Fe-4S cluster-binding domain-containing protein, partial [Anaeromyxobacteraceae bacterium]|nr:4Fe-4S cluster-binding domain-containing protein [Anaeromyxobacteraceae bacterium]